MSYETQKAALDTFRRDHPTAKRLDTTGCASEFHWCRACGALLELEENLPENGDGYIFAVPTRLPGCGVAA